MKPSMTFALVPLSLSLSLFAAPDVRSQEPVPIEEELTELFRKIREDLRVIDRLLLEAGGEGEAAERAADAVEGMRRLLEETQAKQRAVVDRIDEVLEKAPTCPGCGGSGSPSPERERPSQATPEERQREQGPEQPGLVPPRLQEPRSESPVPPHQREGRDRRDRPDPERAEHPASGGQWGNLPPVAEELLTNPNTDDLPIRYRRWIEEYFRRVQRTDR